MTRMKNRWSVERMDQIQNAPGGVPGGVIVPRVPGDRGSICVPGLSPAHRKFLEGSKCADCGLIGHVHYAGHDIVAERKRGAQWLMTATDARGRSHMMQHRDYQRRLCDALQEVDALIFAACARECYSTILDFERVEVSDGVKKELERLGYKVKVCQLRSVCGFDGDAVPSLEVSW